MKNAILLVQILKLLWDIWREAGNLAATHKVLCDHQESEKVAAWRKKVVEHDWTHPKI